MTAAVIPIESKLPAQAIEIEQAVLGALLVQQCAWPRVVDLLRPEMFHNEAHRQIYRTARDLNSQGTAVDLLTVTVALKSAGLLESLGGAFYVTQLTNKVVSAANIEHHVHILIECYILRRLGSIGVDALKSSTSPFSDAFALMDALSTQLTDLYAETQPTVMKTAADRMRELTDKRDRIQYHTFGIPDLDRYAILEAGLPVVVAGRPGIGKSIFCLEVCWHLTLAGSVLLFSPEMTDTQVTARILARESGVSYSSILRGRMNEQEFELVTSTSQRIADRMLKLKIDDRAGVTPDQIRAATERAMRTDDIVAFAVDHLHKMRSGDKRLDRDPVQMVGHCMNGVTEVAKRTKLPALVMAQLNRAVESRPDKRPTMADLKWSGDIEQDAAVVALLYREGYYMPEPPFEDDLEMILGKNRDGRVGTAFAKITPACSRIGEATGRQTIVHPDNRYDDAPF